MKAILISIKPKYCELIANGKKTVEVRKTKPKIDVPFKVYIYETRNGGHRCKNCKEKNDCYSYAPKNVGCYNGQGKVIGEFVCKNVESLNERDLFEGMDEISNSRIEEYSCLNIDELLQYKGDKQEIYGWHITDLVIYDKPKELGEFTKACNSKKADCGRCKRKITEKLSCIAGLTRPPQSWCYVEELGV